MHRELSKCEYLIKRKVRKDLTDSPRKIHGEQIGV